MFRRGQLGVIYPFTAIVDQEAVKEALILNAIDPTIGGVLISGPKGTGKSLLVRALSQILPEVEHVVDCPFRCNPADPTNMCPSCLTRQEAGEILPVAKEPMRIVQVPLSITDDMLVGNIDVDRALDEGVRALQPGLLAEANQNILYIDEVNLLPDHITDSILDAAASGWNVVEREGISVQHPSRFILIGTMNPEEGELRPQILDRFGVYAETRNIDDPELRALIFKRNEEFHEDPFNFVSKYRDELENLRSRIEAARGLYSEIDAPPEAYSKVAETCAMLRVDGFRPDIVAVKAAKSLAAFDGRRMVEEEYISRGLELALGHRTRKSGLVPPPSKTEIKRAFEKVMRPKLRSGLIAQRIEAILNLPSNIVEDLAKRARRSQIIWVLLFAFTIIISASLIETVRSILIPTPPNSTILLVELLGGILLSTLVIYISQRSRTREERALGIVDLSKLTIEARGRLSTDRGLGTGDGMGSAKVTYGKGLEISPDYGEKILSSMEMLKKAPMGIKPLMGKPARGVSYGGRRSRAVSTLLRGRYSWYTIPRGRAKDIALVPTLIAAALHQSQRVDRRISITPEDIRVKVREYHAPFSIILLIDMSLSMIDSMDSLVEAIYSFHKDVYRRRDRVGLIVFKGSRAFTLQHPTSNLQLVAQKLRGVGASDFTPMAAGLFESLKILKMEKMRNRDAIPTLVIISDGIVNVPLGTPISLLSRRRYVSEAQADCFDMARLLKKEGVRVHVINTKHVEESLPPIIEGRRLRLTPTQFLIELARISKGEYHDLTLSGSLKS